MLNVHFLTNMTFIHIPKTGGTSVEALLTKEQAVFHRYKKPPSSPWLSPWHFPPDLFEMQYGVSYDRPPRTERFCVVRAPEERFRSCQLWSRGRYLANRTTLEQAYGHWSRTTPTEELLHRMPQHMFVWTSDGRVQCQCVIAFEKMTRLLSVHLNKRTPSVTNNTEMNRHWRAMQSLYRQDESLHMQALRSKQLCYRPNRRSRRMEDGAKIT